MSTSFRITECYSSPLPQLCPTRIPKTQLHQVVEHVVEQRYAIFHFLSHFSGDSGWAHFPFCKWPRPSQINACYLWCRLAFPEPTLQGTTSTMANSAHRPSHKSSSLVLGSACVLLELPQAYKRLVSCQRLQTPFVHRKFGVKSLSSNLRGI